ncbi:MAG: hotdog fold thioesterase [Bacteroidetes bacterium]|nr:hotdog fold thioesterase [Bacteroidota bacterium]
MERIWRYEPTIEQLNKRGQNTMVEHLNIKFTEMGPNFLRGSMPVDHRTNQPIGLLHGGASVVLAETLGSVAGVLCVDIRKEYCVGIEVNANHLRSARSGRVIGTATPIHLGRKTHVWQIIIEDNHGRKVTASRLTLAILQWDPDTPGLEDRIAWLTH